MAVDKSPVTSYCGLILILSTSLFIGAFAHPSVPAPSKLELDAVANGESPRVLETQSEFNQYFAKKGMKTVSPAASVCQASYGDLMAEVQSYATTVNEIVLSSIAGPFTNKTYNDLSQFVDTFGSRLSGSDTLEKSIDYIQDLLMKSGADNLQSETVSVPAWKRGSEIATLLEPRLKNLAIFGLGQTVNTPLMGITADVVVYNSYLEIVANPTAAIGKIAVLNFGGPAISPLDTTNNGYNILANIGARATLYRSAATFSLYSPHARRSSLYYDATSPRIPIAYLTIEDCQLLSRMAQRGQNIRIRLSMQNTRVDRWANSRNIFADLTGKENKDEYILFAGHTDSWDVGEGAQDDAVGVMLPIESLQLLKSLNLTPRRTIRLAFWTGEEYGYAGSVAYIANATNRQQIDNNLSVALEADYSCLASTGLIFNGLPELACILQEIINLVGTAGTTGLLVQSPSVKSDMDNFSAINVPVVTLLGDDGRYFWFHHTEADTMTAVNSQQLDRCLALWTSTAYILADLKNKVTRVPAIPS